MDRDNIIDIEPIEVSSTPLNGTQQNSQAHDGRSNNVAQGGSAHAGATQGNAAFANTTQSSAGNDNATYTYTANSQTSASQSATSQTPPAQARYIPREKVRTYRVMFEQQRTAREPSRLVGLVWIALGIILALVGIPMLVLPGPGLLAICGGIALIASGFRRLFGPRRSANAGAGS